MLIRQLAFEVLMYTDNGVENIIKIAELLASAEEV